jgi:uncharacterized membrane protein
MSFYNLSTISVIETLLIVRISVHVLFALSRGIVEMVIVVIIVVIMIGVSMVVMFSEIFIIKVEPIFFQDTYWSK